MWEKKKSQECLSDIWNKQLEEWRILWLEQVWEKNAQSLLVDMFKSKYPGEDIEFIIWYMNSDNLR